MSKQKTVKKTDSKNLVVKNVEPVKVQAKTDSDITLLQWSELLQGEKRTKRPSSLYSASELLIEHFRRHATVVPTVAIPKEALEIANAPVGVVVEAKAGASIYYATVEAFFLALGESPSDKDTGRLTHKATNGERIASCKSSKSPGLFLNGLYSPSGERDESYKKEGMSNPFQVVVSHYDKKRARTSIQELVTLLQAIA
mgnify:CR=1 FL=1